MNSKSFEPFESHSPLVYDDATASSDDFTSNFDKNSNLVKMNNEVNLNSMNESQDCYIESISSKTIRESPDPAVLDKETPVVKQTATSISNVSQDIAPTNEKKKKVPVNDSDRSTDNEVIRTGTIRRIMKIDKDVKMTGLEAVNLVSKATEHFLGLLVDTCVEIADNDGRKTVKYSDVVAAAKDLPEFDFLNELLPNIEKMKAKEKELYEKWKAKEKDALENSKLKEKNTIDSSETTLS